jgi:uncharacterized protein
MESPCVLICQIDDQTGLCFGCGRTGNEIMGWINMSGAERRAIMVEVPARLETITRRPRKITRRQEIEALRQQRTIEAKQ